MENPPKPRTRPTRGQKHPTHTHPHTPQTQNHTHNPPHPNQTKSTTMPTAGTHAAAKKRTQRAYKLKCAGRTWTEIADQLGYSGPGSACKAVTTWLAKQPPEKLAEARHYAAGSYRLVITQLWEITANAKTNGDTSGAVTALRAIAEVQDKHNKLLGIAPSAATEVTVNVGTGTAAAIIDQAEQQLLAISAAAGPQRPGAPLEVLDAEVIEA
jgi:hypothetical protein